MGLQVNILTMDKKDIKNILRERANTPHVKHVKAVKNDEADENDYDKITSLLDNDIINHAAVVRQLKNKPWAGNTEATNRSLFRKKLKKLPNDDGGEYTFSEETVSNLQKILMNLSSTINHSIGRKGQ